MRTSQAGIDLICKFEGFSHVEYLCPAGKRTIAYGHCIRDGEHFDQPMTESEGLGLLLVDLPTYEAGILDVIDAPLSQGNFDACVAFTYNLGIHAFATSTLARKIQARDYDGAANEFLKWDIATVNGKKVRLPGLANRRAAERELFLS